ncbi:MAG: molybdate ABC transporter permease subunit, partial [Planctomycetes bacterium]|nr:molybdate ABC transporter permease subunit [Planctomycetota bacterium]
MTTPLRKTHRRVLPGFGLSLGYTLAYLGLIVLIPLSTLVFSTARMGWSGFWRIATDENTISAFKLTFGAALIAAAVNVVFGFVVAWTLVRYRFRGQRILDALVDLPFGLPTAVSGIVLTEIFAETSLIG